MPGQTPSTARRRSHEPSNQLHTGHGREKAIPHFDEHCPGKTDEFVQTAAERLLGMKNIKKILVPVDGSERALRAVKYLSWINIRADTEIVLLHIFDASAEDGSDTENGDNRLEKSNGLHIRPIEQKQKIARFMDRSRKILAKAGFKPQSIETVIKDCRTGVAQDIIKEASKSFDAVVIRRRGLTGMRGIILGSVSHKLVEKLNFIPLILVGRTIPGYKIMIAFDGSANCLRSIDFLTRFLNPADYRIYLFHAVRTISRPTSFHGFVSDPIHTRKISGEMRDAIWKAKKRLVTFGYSSDQYTETIVRGVYSRAKAIANEAKKEHIGTIALGRKGLSNSPDFSIGRVTNKVISLARDKTLWVIP